MSFYANLTEVDLDQTVHALRLVITAVHEHVGSFITPFNDGRVKSQWNDKYSSEIREKTFTKYQTLIDMCFKLVRDKSCSEAVDILNDLNKKVVEINTHPREVEVGTVLRFSEYAVG